MPRMERDESPKTRVTVRVPEDLVEEFDEYVERIGSNRSEWVRERMRSSLSYDADDDDRREPPQDDASLNKAYRALREVSEEGRAIPMREAKSVVAQKTNIPADLVGRRIITPLRQRGYLERCGDPFRDPWVIVR